MAMAGLTDPSYWSSGGTNAALQRYPVVLRGAKEKMSILTPLFTWLAHELALGMAFSQRSR